MKKYLIVALYSEDFQRYATEVIAGSPHEAETLAQELCAEDNQMEPGEEPLIIAAVLCGRTDEETAAIEVVA